VSCRDALRELFTGPLVVGLLVVAALAGCGSSHESRKTTYSVADVRKAFAQHGVKLRESSWFKHHGQERLAVLLPQNGASDHGLALVWVDVSESFAKLSAGQVNRKPATRDSQIRNLEVMWDPTNRFVAPVRAAIADLRTSR
jgi:hypothetical protein